MNRRVAGVLATALLLLLLTLMLAPSAEAATPLGRPDGLGWRRHAPRQIA
jgi:hypothetical protein